MNQVIRRFGSKTFLKTRISELCLIRLRVCSVLIVELDILSICPLYTRSQMDCNPRLINDFSAQVKTQNPTSAFSESSIFQRISLLMPSISSRSLRVRAQHVQNPLLWYITDVKLFFIPRSQQKVPHETMWQVYWILWKVQTWQLSMSRIFVERRSKAD